jgi:phosphatidylserine/phosphatidylglycerophosphate/cardiolipin synthase-like enzyme
MAAPINERAIDGVIQRHIRAFRKPGVLTVRPGYKMTGGWITDKPAIVATVNKKLDGLPPSQKLPAEIGDTAVDVREATSMQRLRAVNPAAHALVVAHGRGEIQEPNWKYERAVPSGQLLSKTPPPKSASSKQISSKPQIPYTPAAQQLAPVTRNMTIIAHASPDDGYPVLTDFLAQTKSRLTVAMYDFTSGDILKAVIAAIQPAKRPYQMVLDHPPKNPTANQTDAQTVSALESADSNAAINWALTRNDPQATEWIFPTAYHIKVAVRDGNSFWLSSGNWNVSNQPNLQAKNRSQGSLSNADRDWHVVVLDAGLAQLYESYIQHDFTVAASGQGPGDAAMHAQIRSALQAHAAEQKKSSVVAQVNSPQKPSTLGQHKIFTNVPVTIQPLLTPDPGTHGTLYVDKVLALIQAAQQSVYMQTQYIHPSASAGDANFMLLVQAMSDALGRGLDVRLITSQYENTPQWVELLKPFNLDHVLRIQNRVHNKGIVIDSRIVMVSSQNWSADGTLRNRDAGLIINNADIAQYFQAIFMDDWINRADVKLVDASYPATSGGRSKSPKPSAAKKTPPRKKS